MQLSAGTRIGPYEILALLGAGGMGEVYRARDHQLNRDVALKVLSAALAQDADYMARFQREAHVLAALNHPNIAQIYGLEQNTIAMELVEGEELRGPLPLEEALKIARQIAEALEAAHEKGIVHRDLKPANIKIKPDGTVKVLDFGLAKATDAPAGASSEVSPTISMRATQAGAILGTAAYMAPEQARGKVVDKRADIWAFGVVLHEMLTGQKLFQGDDLSETLAAVIKEDPKLERAPAKVRRLLRSCLEKDPKQRLQAIGDWRLLLEDRAPPAPSGIPGSAGGLAAGVLAVVAAVALWAPWRSENPVDGPLVRLDVDLGADVSLPAPTYVSNVVISPDGRRLVYVSGTPTRLFTRRLDQAGAAELPGTQAAYFPFFSPDGQSVGFVVGTKLNKISVEGGAVVPLGNIATFATASWGEDGSILVSDAYREGLLRFPSGGGPPETVAGLRKGEMALAFPQILPGGKAILFAAATGQNVDKFTIEVLTLADRRRKTVARGGTSPRYLATSGKAGHLIYVHKATLFAIPFDPDKLETRGTAVAVLDDVAYDTSYGTGQFDVSSAPRGHGTLVYRRASASGSATSTLQWVDATGKKEPLGAKPDIYEYLSLSPDGKRVALTFTEGGDIWVYDPQRAAMTRLTFGGGSFDNPTWSRDGKYVVFGSFGQGILEARADGAGQPQVLIESKATLFPAAFTPDGKRLAYNDYGAGNTQIWTAPLEDRGSELKAGKPEPFLKSGFNDFAQAFSPDGRWLAYFSDESGKAEVYVRAFPPPSSGPGEKWQISNGGGLTADWSRNGHDLVYRSGADFMAASYTVKGDTFVADKPRLWIAKFAGNVWALAPDGKRVLVAAPVGSAEAPKPDHEIVFLENFFDYLRQRVPLGK